MTESSPVRFKFLLGEALLADWRPRLVTVLPPTDATKEWPAEQDLPAGPLPPGAAGLWCQQVAPERFPIGVSRVGRWLSYVPRQQRLYFVELVGSFSDYLGRRSAKSRYNLKRAIKLLRDANAGPILEIVTDAADMARFHRTAVAISKVTYQAKLLQVGLPDTPQFLAAMEAKAQRGEARGYLLKDQGEAIAFAWCTAAGRRMTYDVIGYLPQRAAASPGTVLLALIIEDLFALNRYDMFDFGVGESFYKSAFATNHLDYADAYMFAPTLRHHVLIRTHWYLDRFSSTVGAWLEKKGLKKKVKALIRKLRGVGDDGS